MDTAGRLAFTAQPAREATMGAALDYMSMFPDPMRDRLVAFLLGEGGGAAPLPPDTPILDRVVAARTEALLPPGATATLRITAQVRSLVVAWLSSAVDAAGLSLNLDNIIGTLRTGSGLIHVQEAPLSLSTGTAQWPKRIVIPYQWDSTQDLIWTVTNTGPVGIAQLVVAAEVFVPVFGV